MNNQSDISSPSSKKALQDTSGKTGMIKRLMNWIARGVAKQDKGANACPT